jgi:hypothetical protein
MICNLIPQISVSCDFPTIASAVDADYIRLLADNLVYILLLQGKTIFRVETQLGNSHT